ncbi:TPA: hypothetical protein RRE64_005434 [Klebsiella pneumoniae]|nr:hypothetical protein [Klebsiella pneumoniae]
MKMIIFALLVLVAVLVLLLLRKYTRLEFVSHASLLLKTWSVRPAPLRQRLKSPLPRLNLPGPFCSHRGSGFLGSLYADYFFSN